MSLTIAKCYVLSNSIPSVPLDSNLLCNRNAMDNKAIRRANLLYLIELHNTIKALAEATGSVPNHLSEIKNKGRNMGDDVARRIEEKLDKPRGWMDRLQVPPDRVGNSVEEPHSDYNMGGVPVVGTAQLGDDGYWHELEYPAGHGEGFVKYPTRDPNTYALRVKGDSMRPRIKPGEFVVIEPNHPVSLGEEVMVQTKDGRSMVKLLVSRRGGLVELHSVNEDHRPLTIEEGQVSKIHYVGGILKASMYYEKM